MFETQFLQQNSLKTLSDKLYSFQTQMVDEDLLIKTAFEIRAFSRKRIIELRGVYADNVDDEKETKSIISFVNSIFTF